MAGLADFVHETATDPGRGAFILNGAPSGRRLFSAAFGMGARVYYFAYDGTQAEWGIGTLDVSGPVTLSRDSIAGTTAGGAAALDFRGTIDVHNEVPAEYLPLIGPDGLARVGDHVLADRDWVAGRYADTAFLKAQYTPAGWFPAGAVLDFTGQEPPPGWLPCQGQTLARAAYPLLFAALGTAYGAGDGATTFSLPDLRGRAVFGLDSMGRLPAGRITRQASGVEGGQLGHAGGSQFLQAHQHDVVDPGHTHDLVDPGHLHTPAQGSGFVVPAKTGGTIDAHFAGGGDDDEFAVARTDRSPTGVRVLRAETEIETTAEAGQGGSQNMPPALVLGKIIYTGQTPRKVTTGPVLTARATLIVPFTDSIPRTITWETADGTAVAGVDYEDTEGGLLIPPGWTQVSAPVPITPRVPGLPALTFDVIFKWYDKTVPPVAYGSGQLTGWPIYPVRRQAVTVTIADIPLTLATGDLPRTARWVTRDGTARAGTHYQAAMGDNSAGRVTILAAPFGRGQEARSFSVDFTDAGGLIATRTVEIRPPVLPVARAASTRVAITPVAQPACIPALSFTAPRSVDNPDRMPVSTMRSLASDWHVENQGADQGAVMTLDITSADCALQIFGEDFPGAYTQDSPGAIRITGTAERITAVRGMFQARPLASGAGHISFVLSAPDGTTDRLEYAVLGVLSSPTWQGLPPDGTVLTVISPSTHIPDAGSSLTVANDDPFVDMTLTIEPDEYGGWVLGPVGAAVSVSPTGRGIIIRGSAAVMAIVLVPLTIYVGEGITPAPTAGPHVLSMTATDGTTTITTQYHYTVTL